MILMRKTINALFISILLAGMVFANVIVSLSDVEVDGYTEDIIVSVNLSNPNDGVGGFQFDVIALPTLVELSGVTPLDEENFSADYTVFDDGSGRIVFYSNNATGIGAGGDGVVLNLHFDGSDILSASLDLDMYALAVSDEDGNVLESSAEGGSITIGDVVTISATTDTGDVNEEVFLDINLENPGVVGGLQFDLYDTPDYLDVTAFSTTDRTSGFSVDFTVLDNGMTRVIMYDANNGNIDAGDGAILNMTMVVHNNAYNSNVGVNFDNVIVTDEIGGTYWVAGADSGTVTVTPGYIEEPHNLEAQDGMDAQVLLMWDPPYGPIPEDFAEDFELGEIPEGWTVTTNSAQGWFITQDGSSTFWAIPAHTWYMCSNDDMADDDGSMDYLVTPPLNVSGAQTITLNFASYYTGAYSQTAHIEVSTDGTNFTEVSQLEPSAEWVTETVDLSEHAGVPNLYIAFHSNDNGVWASGWAIDDVFITFAARDVARIDHYELTELGEWAITAPKEDVISEYSGGIPHELIVDLDYPVVNENRPVDIDAYKVYRSYNPDSGFEEIVETDGNTTTYLDENVVNSTTYYYYVTAIYPDGSESGPTNTASATPVEWVELWMDDGSSLTGQMDTLDFYINNETNLGLFYFEIMDYPDVINSINIFPTDRTANWSIEISNQGNGTIAITGISLGGPLTAGDGAVCSAILYPDADEAMTVSLSYTNATAVQDMNFTSLNWTSESGTYEVGIETQYVTLTGGYGDDGSSFTSSLILDNTQPVYGLHLDIAANPPFMIGTEVNVSGAHDFSEWEVSGMVIGNFYRVTMVNNAHNAPINPGISHIADVTFEIPVGIPDGSEVILDLQDAEITDINDLPMHTVSIPGNVYIGIPPVAYTIQNVSSTLVPGGTGTFEINLDNTELVGTMQFTLVEMPESMTVTNVIPVGRFDDGIVDGSSEELDDGTYYFLGYDFSSGIEAGSGPILEFEVQFDDNLYNSSIIMSMAGYAAGDAGANPLITVFHGFGQFTGYTVALDEEIGIPGEFALHPNFPNPFNPSTMIAYDLPEASDVRLEIYDLIGRNINTVVNQNKPAGRHFIIWNANDYLGNQVSAGVYLYRLQAGNKIFTRKMILMK